MCLAVNNLLLTLQPTMYLPLSCTGSEPVWRASKGPLKEWAEYLSDKNLMMSH